MPKDATINLRIDPDLREELQKIADEDDRSLAYIARAALSEYVCRKALTSSDPSHRKAAEQVIRGLIESNIITERAAVDMLDQLRSLPSLDPKLNDAATDYKTRTRGSSSKQKKKVA